MPEFIADSACINIRTHKLNFYNININFKLDYEIRDTWFVK